MAVPVASLFHRSAFPTTRSPTAATSGRRAIAIAERGHDHPVLDSLLRRARRTRWAQLAVANLRIFIGFAFVPAGLKKLLAEPFTAPHLHGPFHDFLHAFHATGFFYQFVGVMQLVTASLMITQRFATLGALLAMPILTTIMVFCWSTKVYPTATVVTSMWLGTLLLVLWDGAKWRAVFLRDAERAADPRAPAIDPRLWERCGVAVMCLYLAVCAVTGSVYRPRGAEWASPAFYVFPAMLLVVLATFVVDQARARRARHAREPFGAPRVRRPDD